MDNRGSRRPRPAIGTRAAPGRPLHPGVTSPPRRSPPPRSNPWIRGAVPVRSRRGRSTPVAADR
ncbi:hypothetical protein ACFFX0_07800 [Citricoccus parietis]|uniref:Uncharacterized protein n=1 Tax=Citricoccus parietis TaxID=592307 RepID=A0ABV5FWQ8_9MICC